MTLTLPTPLAARARRRSIWAVFALVGALVATGAATPAAAEVVGEGPGTISGTITSTDGSPLEGVFVSASSTSVDGYTFTDSSGFYELSGLALDESTYISVYLNGFENPDGAFETLTASSPTLELNYTLTPFPTGVGTVSGYVTGDGTPLAGVYVSAAQDSTGQSLNSTTDENGYYQITGLANGEWRIYAYAGEEYQTAQDPIVVVTDAAPDTTADIAFISYPSGTSGISGVVTDAATGDPIAGVYISLYSADVPQNGSATTNESGEYAFDLLPAGTFNLQLHADGYLELADEFTVADGETVTADRGLIAKNATISGHLQLADGTPVVGEWVQAESVDGFNWGSGLSDENGDYVISDLGGVAYTASVGGNGSAYDRQAQEVTAVANDDTTANFTVVPRTTGSLIGYVYQPGGEPYLKPVCVTLYSAKNKKPVAELYVDGEHYGADEFYFNDLRPGTYTVEVRDCDDDPTTKFAKVFLGGVKHYKDATFITVAAAEDTWGNNIEFAPRSN